MKSPAPLRRPAVLACAAIALALPLPDVQAQEVPPGASLESLLAYAREHSPELHAERLEAEAAGERAAAAVALPDPMLQVELMDVTNAMSGGSGTVLPGEVGTTRYRITQPLPFYGKRALRGEVAEAEAERARSRVLVAGTSLRAGIRGAYARYYRAAGEARILIDTLTLAEALERLALARYEVGLVPQQDVIQAQSEITALRVELADAVRARREAQAQVNALLPRDPWAPLAEPQALPVSTQLLAAESGFAALLQRVRAASPELAGERAGAGAAERARALTYRDRYPDFAIGLANNQVRRGTDSWDLMLEVNIPLQQGSRRAREREAERALEAAQARVAAAEARLAGQLGEQLAAFEASRDKAHILRHTLVPQAEANLEAARAGYETGRVSFNALIEAERQIRRTRLALLAAEVDTELAVTALEQLAGAPL